MSEASKTSNIARSRCERRSLRARTIAPTLVPRIGAHVRKVPSIENGGKKSGTGERARICAAALQSLPLAEGDRRLWETYIRRQRGVQGARTGGKGVVRWGGRGEGGKECIA